MPSKQAYARQRLLVGLALGFGIQLVFAFILGIMLAGGFSWTVRVTSTLISSVIATPAVLSAGFAFMLKDETRSFGVGGIAGALGSTLLLALLYLVF